MGVKLALTITINTGIYVNSNAELTSTSTITISNNQFTTISPVPSWDNPVYGIACLCVHIRVRVCVRTHLCVGAPICARVCMLLHVHTCLLISSFLDAY